MATPDSILQKINRTFVCLDSDDKKYVTTHYKKVLDKLITSMKCKDRLFNELYKELNFAGSFYDGLKICKPEEFDVNIVINLPIDYKEIKLLNEKVSPGFIKVQALRLKELQQGNNFVYKDMQGWTDRDGFLLQSEFRKWMIKVVDDTLESLPRKMDTARLLIGGEVYRISRRSQGPAITLHVTLPDGGIFEVDLVPVLEFKHSEHWPPQVRKNPFPGIESWFIVPKCNSRNPKEFRDTFWRLSFNEQEKELMNDKGQLKSTCRLVKKLRDCHAELGKICSYYIKTVILWKVEEKQKEDPSYWKNTALSHQFLDVLKMLAQKLNDGKLEYYWEKNFNLLDSSGMTEMEQLHTGRNLSRIIREMEMKMYKNPSVLVEQLLTAEEQAAFTYESPEETQPAVPGVGVGAIYFQNSDRQVDGTVATLQKELYSLRESFNKHRLETGRMMKALVEVNANLQDTLDRQQSGIGKLFRGVKQFESVWGWIYLYVMIFLILWVKFLEIEQKCSVRNGTVIEDTIDNVYTGEGPVTQS